MAIGPDTLGVTAPHRWDGDAAMWLDPRRRGVVRIIGGPGTGKTSLLVDIAAARIASGVDPESVLLLTGSGRLGGHARALVTATWLRAHGGGDGQVVVRRPLVRSVHAYAFAVLTLAAQRAGDPPPRLITGAEQDGAIRELLAGDLEDGAHGWPSELRPALRTTGFATELRDLMARCVERGVDPSRLQRLGRVHRRPEWVAAGRFARQYEQVTLLRSAAGMAAPQATIPACGAAELVGAALQALSDDPGLLAGEHTRVTTLLIDDAQHLDPQAARLVRVLAEGIDTVLVAGDPDQAAFGFRGADPVLLTDARWPAVLLDTSHRCAPAVARAIAGIGSLLPGEGPARRIVASAVEQDKQGEVTALLASSEAAESELIADTLRRAHLIDGVAWSQMAVIVRSMSRAGLPRVLAAAGVPVAAPAADPPLRDNAIVGALLTVLEAAAEGLTGQRAQALLAGPIGRVDPVTLRGLRRALRRADGCSAPREFGDLLVESLTDGVPDGLATVYARPLRRIRAVLQAAGRAGGDDPAAALWQAWRRSGLQRGLLIAADRHGLAGQRAVQNLNAVTAMFDLAGQFVSHTPGASVPGLVAHVQALRLPVTAAEPRSGVEAITILSPHQALGHQWDVVVLAGLQEGLWPNTIPRGGVLATQRLIDVLDGVHGVVSTRAPLVADERRLLITAMGRARRRLVVTAVDGSTAESDELPSPFFYDIARYGTDEQRRAAPFEPVAAPRILSVPAVVGRLRSVVCAPQGAFDDTDRTSAATQLARLAAAGVPGADPAGWQGLTVASCDEPLWSGEDHQVTVSPSSLQLLIDCPLRWLAERHGGSDPNQLRSIAGVLIHALVARSDRTEAQLIAELEHVWAQLPFESRWFAENELQRHRDMLSTFLAWRRQSRHELTEIGVEIEVDGVLDLPGGGPEVRVRGRIDRLERDGAGRVVVVDVKTGKSPVSKDDAQHHAQLALYQVAVAAGLAPQTGEPGGARLVYVAKPCADGATERAQDALTPQTGDQWRQQVVSAAAETAGPRFAARINDGCAHCPLRGSCPTRGRA